MRLNNYGSNKYSQAISDDKVRVSYLVVVFHNLSTRITKHRPWEFVSQTTKCGQGLSLCGDFVRDLSDTWPHFQLRVMFILSRSETCYIRVEDYWGSEQVGQGTCQTFRYTFNCQLS